MGWVLVGIVILVVLAVFFHLLEEYFWAIVFMIAAGVLGSVLLVMANMPSVSGP